MNNPKITYIMNLLGMDYQECDILLIEFSEGKSYIYLYSSEKSNPNKPDAVELSLNDMCGLLTILTRYKFDVGTENIDSVYNTTTHQKVLSVSLSLPGCLFHIQYEDETISDDFSPVVEFLIRESFKEVY